MTEFEESKAYLLAILKTFKNRTIIVKFTANGPAHIGIRTRVIRRLAEFGIPFPFDEIANTPAYKENGSIDANKLTVIVEEAIADYLETYLDDPNHEEIPAGVQEYMRSQIEYTYDWLDEHFGNYTDEELEPFMDDEDDDDEEENPVALQNKEEAFVKALEWLHAAGYKKVRTYRDLDHLLWNLAYRHQPMDGNMKEAMKSMTKDVRLLNAIEKSVRAFNALMEKNRLAEHGSIEVIGIKPKYISLGEHEAIVNNMRHEMKLLRRNLTTKADGIVHGRRVTCNMFIDSLCDPDTRYGATFDMTKEEDVREFLKWFHFTKRHISDKTRARYNEKFGNPEVFNRLVDEYNAQFITTSEEGDEENATTATNPE